MSNITISYNGKTISAESGIRVSDILPKNNTVIAALVNNHAVPLSYRLQINCTVKPLTAADQQGMNVYRRSLSFLLGKAVSELFPDRMLHIEHSLGPGFYYDLDGAELTQDDIKSIKEEMLRQVKADKPIQRKYAAYCDAIEQLKAAGRTDKIKLLLGLNPPQVAVYQCDEYIEIYEGPLAAHTGQLGIFDLIPYHGGLILQFPKKSDITKPAVFTAQDRIFDVHHKSIQYSQKIGAGTIGDLNEIIMNGQLGEFIQLSETLQHRNLIELTDAIHNKPETRLIAIAGPSSSGKTTFSKRLSLQLKTLGITPVTISVDDYFIDRAKTPRGADGQPDYECLEALNIDALNQNLSDLISGKETHLLHYDFMTGLSSVRPETARLKPNEVIVIEGIHCLNDALTPAISRDKKFKIYISALTPINIDNNVRLPTTDNRLLRRMIRDSKYRGHSAKTTLSMWPNVRAGEEKHIFPYQNTADGYFNSALNYEMAILKPYAEPLLKQIKPCDEEYAEAIRLLRLLSYFLAADDDEVPIDSLVREFIGGSFFSY